MAGPHPHNHQAIALLQAATRPFPANLIMLTNLQQVLNERGSCANFVRVLPLV